LDKNNSLKNSLKKIYLHVNYYIEQQKEDLKRFIKYVMREMILLLFSKLMERYLDVIVNMDLKQTKNQ
jgi:hypothetical protein